MQIWRFINSGPADAFTNMATDEAIMIAYQRGLVPPTLRIYQWNPPAVSVGYFQKTGETVDVKMCKTLGIDVVKRLTGGRAVLHEHEITYSVIIGENYPGMPGSIVESYKFICKGVIEGFRLLGIEVSMETRKNKSSIINSSACFDSPSMYEILYEGKKLVGSAQVRKNGVILQHGSILMDFDIEKMINVLIFKFENLKEKVKNALINNTTTVRKILGAEICQDEMITSIKKGFESAFGVKMIEKELIVEEKELIKELFLKYCG